ncbi:STM3941 family protein [Helicovermis profundi]|uniref:Uncharacterized protein n=1 Tax=Helicovermis profundi TaxID=3065157 RepID=A0AAU9E1V2_9FIRM|nr:hypothetical protein HLPR_01560 [Clostridia bacterium S502]
MNTISIKENKDKLIGLVFSGIIGTCFSVFSLIMGVVGKNILLIIIGIIATLFLGICATYIIRRSIKTISSEPAVELIRISDEGIFDLSSMISTGLISWSEVKSIRIVRCFTQKFIGIEVNNVEKYLMRISSTKRMVAKLNMMMKFPPINISVNTFDVNIEELANTMKDRLLKYNDKSIL